MIIILLNYILVVICTLLVIIPTWKLIKAVIKRKKDGSEPESGLLTAAMISNTLAVAIIMIQRRKPWPFARTSAG